MSPVLMDVLTFIDAAEFAAVVQPVIDRFPAFTSVLATNLDQNLHGPGLEAYWFLIRDAGRPVGAAMLTPPLNIVLTPIDGDLSPADLGVLVEAVQRAGLRPAGVSGPVAEVASFAAVWRERTGVQGRPTSAERLYDIDAPPRGPDVEGDVRLATEADLELAVAWVREFTREALPDQPMPDAGFVVRRRLSRGRLLFWMVGGEPVSMAGTSRPIAGVARIGSVFTPKAFRGRGFGSAVTAAATRQGFTDGAERCMLYTDLANPTSNKIYQAIGYRPIGDATVITF